MRGHAVCYGAIMATAASAGGITKQGWIGPAMPTSSADRLQMHHDGVWERSNYQAQISSNQQEFSMYNVYIQVTTMK